ncbi:MAG TPA: N-acetylmuramoyl-L-alanine amidase, partial [Agriterribacter sp.]|nr:N-acetylmuramoyl-L-alanine amidase [Agriterribacter sp.]
FHLSGEQVAMVMYMAVSVVLMVILFHALMKLNRLIRRNPLQKIQQINVVQTAAKGAPFSFFRYIFWNKNIDMYTDAGKKIFTHEMVHVTEKHSADRLFMNIVLIFSWCNPFFWLIRREMNMIHEFIADSKAIEDSDTTAFAAMILHAAYPQQAFGLTSSFFSSSVKRRLHMLTKTKNPGMNYISRLLALPLLTFIFVAFTVKTKQLSPNQNGMTPVVKLEAPITVVVDAGHGGDDGGAISTEGIREKDITLSLSKKINTLNNNRNIKIILTRDKDITQPVRDKVDFAVLQKPDLFISLHVAQVNPNGGDKTKSGFEIYLSKNQTGYTKEAQLFGSLVAGEIEKNYGVAPEIKQRTGKGIWVLDAPVINYPALLIECGYLSNPDDIAFITDEKKQEKIARDILNAIEQFAKAKEEGIVIVQTASQPSLNAHSPRQEGNVIASNSSTAVKKELKTAIDTLPANVKSVDVTRDNQVIIIYKNNTAEKITKAEAIKRGIVPVAKTGMELFSHRTIDSVLYFIDGIEFSKSGLEKINPNDIESINVIRDKSAVDKYGARAKNGVIEITLKNNTAPKVQDGDKIFQKVETEAKFPGGEAAWQKYISSSIKDVIDSLQTENKAGTCVVQFIVDTEGNLSEVQPLTMQGTLFARTVTDAIKNGPKWIPAMQNGHKVKAYRKQPVTFQISEE